VIRGDFMGTGRGDHDALPVWMSISLQNGGDFTHCAGVAKANFSVSVNSDIQSFKLSLMSV
jgi:hypothetical protein